MRKIFRTNEAAKYCGLAKSTLEKKRLTGDGPPFVRLGVRAVGYDVKALDNWLDSRTCTRTSCDSHDGPR